MFAPRYFPNHYFAGRYFPAGDSGIIPINGPVFIVACELFLIGAASSGAVEASLLQSPIAEFTLPASATIAESLPSISRTNFVCEVSLPGGVIQESQPI